MNDVVVPHLNKQSLINQSPEILEKRIAREFTIHIDRIAYIFRYVNHDDEAVADAIQSLWPLSKAIFDLCRVKLIVEDTTARKISCYLVI
ncbi:ARM repeat superfamily protein [Euphorbia peplus]|nr:ARM repeat superfamily protein [Euphorbia peplus]